MLVRTKKGIGPYRRFCKERHCYAAESVFGEKGNRNAYDSGNASEGLIKNGVRRVGEKKKGGAQ